MNPARDRIPVVLLTGALGSGKTTLLAAWLRQPALARAALVVNEIGEVGMDDQLLLPLLSTAEGALLANACVCCSGLPGLEQALSDLYRARLERRIARFDSVVIETTGLAEPQPVRAAFEQDSLLRERYVLNGVITTVSAVAPAIDGTRPEVAAQVQGADLLVLTKADRVDTAACEALAARLAAFNARARIVHSEQASLGAQEALHWLRELPAPPSSHPLPLAEEGRGEGHAAHHTHHTHHAEATFLPLPHPLARARLAMALQQAIRKAGTDLLRLKGVLLMEDGLPVAVQWSPGDEDAVMAPFDGAVPTPGLTVIAIHDAAARALARRLQAALERR